MSEVEQQRPATEPILTITWDTVIGSRLVDPGSYDEPPAYEPVDLGGAVVETIAARLIDEIRKDIHTAVQAAVAPTIQAETSAIVRETLSGEIRRTNRWGEPEGAATTLRDMLADDVAAYLREPMRRARYDERKGGFRELLREQVDEVMREELSAEIQKARAAVREQVAAKAAQLFGDVVKEARR